MSRIHEGRGEITVLLATAFIATSCLAAHDLTIEEVAPEHTVLVVAVNDMGAMLDRLKATPAGEHLEAIDTMQDQMLEGLPDSISDAWKTSLEDKSLGDLLSSLRMGIAIYPVVDQETTAVTIGLTMFVDLGEAEESVGPIWDLAMEEVEGDVEDRFEIVEIAETDVIRIDDSDEEEEEDGDPFGGGFPMGMDMDDAFPKRAFLVRVDEHILMSSSRKQMARMLDILAGRDVEGGLGKSDSWEGITGYIGEEGLRMVVLTDHLGELMQAFGQPFMVNMMKPMIIAMLGRIDAMGFSIQAAKDPALASFQMGLWIPEGKAGIMKLMSRNSPREPIPGWASSATSSYGRVNFDFEGVIPWLKEVINSNVMFAMQASQAMEQIEPMLQKLLGGMGNRIQMSKSIDYPLNAKSINNLWVVPAKDGKAFTDALAEVAPQMGFEARDFQGHQIYSMDMSNMMGGMGGPGEIGVAVGGGQIFMGTLPSVEQSLRSVGERSSEDSSVAKTFAPLEQLFSSDP